MIDQYSDDGTGWARLSGDMTMRYRLARVLCGDHAEMLSRPIPGEYLGKRVVFVMLNPSTADAFIVDPTARECLKFAWSWGADVLEIVNLFALRSPHPADLRKRGHGYRGDDAINNDEILAACTGAHRVIAAWGNGGVLDHRDVIVRSMLRRSRIDLYHLGATLDGLPKHPLARGKHRIPTTQQPIPWSAT